MKITLQASLFIVLLLLVQSCSQEDAAIRYYSKNKDQLHTIAHRLELLKDKYKIKGGFIAHQSDLNYWYIDLENMDDKIIGGSLDAQTYQPKYTDGKPKDPVLKDELLISALRLCALHKDVALKIAREDRGIFFMLDLKSVFSTTYTGILISAHELIESQNMNKLERNVYYYETSSKGW